jgi:hypothetical protein
VDTGNRLVRNENITTGGNTTTNRMTVAQDIAVTGTSWSFNSNPDIRLLTVNITALVEGFKSAQEVRTLQVKLRPVSSP